MERRALPRPLKVAALMLLCAAVATPCSWDDTPILFLEARPDAPIDAYVDGRLGIVLPTYARSHLVVAYRYFSGRAPNAVEREGFRDLLRHRLKEYPDGAQPPAPAEQWERMRTMFRGVEYKWPPYGGRGVPGVDYSTFENCTESSWSTAAATFAQRMKEFGARSPEVAKWLDAQELVFTNCDEETAKIPEEDPALPAVLRADRQYQIAAAHFYALHYDDARARFLAIARDTESPWQHVARIVAVRALIRAQDLGVAIADGDPLATADRELRAILADPSMQPLHDAAWDLLAVTTFRRDPQQRFADAAKALGGGETSARRLRVQLADYTLLWDRDVTGDDELTDWIRTFQSGDLAHAVERWQATKGTHWLVAALTHVQSDDASVPALLEASAAHASNTTIAYHRVRLLLAREQYDAARAEAGRALATELPASARNRFLVQRRALARSLEEYLRDVPAQAVAYGTDLADAEESDPTMPPDAAMVLSYWTPVETLVDAALSNTLPERLRNDVRDAAWTRALLLERTELAKKIDPGTSVRTRFDLAYALTQTTTSDPYIEPLGESHGEWWCKGGPLSRDESESTLLPRFLDREDNADAEAKQLYDMGAGATWIFRQLLARAKSHPSDPRVPESLSLAIKATRHTCGDRDTAALAKQAFQLLHRRYAKTKWAEETPYWYDPG